MTYSTKEFTNFKVQACIDWIDLEFDLGRPTQFQWVQREVRRILHLSDADVDLYVKPINPGPGNVTNRFVIRFHDAEANRINKLANLSRRLADAFEGLAQPVLIHAIEVAMDFYPRDPSADCLNLTQRLQMTLEAQGNPRQYDPVLGNFYLVNQASGMTDPSMNLRVGNKKDPISRQVYYKTTDSKPISADQFRARAEFTLRGEALETFGLTTLKNLDGFKFQVLAKLLHFRRLKPLHEISDGKNRPFHHVIQKSFNPEVTPLCVFPTGWKVHRKDSRSGLPREGARLALTHNRHSITNDVLNRLIRKKLTALTKRFAAVNRDRKLLEDLM